MTFPKRSLACLCACLTSIALFSTTPAFASGGGGGGGGDAGLNVKIDPFVVNLADMSRYFRIAFTIQVADPKIGEAIKAMMPAVRHEMILLLSSKHDDELNTAEGKMSLAHEIQKSLNKLIKKDEHGGVTDIFYEAFIVQ